MTAETAHYAECFPQILTIQQDVTALQYSRVVFLDIVSELFNVVVLETGVKAAVERDAFSDIKQRSIAGAAGWV